MYKEFLSGNIFAKVEFAVLIIFFIWVMYKNRNKINIFYTSKFNKVIKFLILVLTIILGSITYPILMAYNVNCYISVAINALFIALLVMFSISMSYWDDKNIDN